MVTRQELTNFWKLDPKKSNLVFHSLREVWKKDTIITMSDHINSRNRKSGHVGRIILEMEAY